MSIINLVDRQLEVYHGPQGDAYQRETVLRVGEFVSPLASPAHRVAVADLLP